MKTLPAVARNQPDWNRDAALIVNRKADKAGTEIYAGDTAGASYDQTKMQALMDAVAALSTHVK
jgi:predicted exporter